MALPDFLIVGAMKCGTSTLAAQLGAQPGIFMTTPKEPNFFSDDAVYAKGLDWYAHLFDGAQPGDLKGEASTHYTKLPTYPNCVDRLTAVLKAPKIIYLIRDPLVRTVSHYMHEWSMGEFTDDYTETFAAHPEMISYSCYGEQIAPYVEAYGAQNILITSLEELAARPQQTLDEICAFLGHPAKPQWHQEISQMNVSSERIRRFPLHDVLIDSTVATTLRRSLVPQSLRDKIKDARRLYDRPAPPPGLKGQLQNLFDHDYALLRSLFPNSERIDASYLFRTE
ncbi:MAG: sulfotransferase domain-containing protein [Sulfitobacter sp.]